MQISDFSFRTSNAYLKLKMSSIVDIIDRKISQVLRAESPVIKIELAQKIVSMNPIDAISSIDDLDALFQVNAHFSVYIFIPSFVDIFILSDDEKVCDHITRTTSLSGYEFALIREASSGQSCQWSEWKMQLVSSLSERFSSPREAPSPIASVTSID